MHGHSDYDFLILIIYFLKLLEILLQMLMGGVALL